jgi:hypothetical protein
MLLVILHFSRILGVLYAVRNNKVSVTSCMSEISCSHDHDYEDDSLLGYCAVLSLTSYRRLEVFTVFIIWAVMKQCASLKRL